MRYGFIGLGNMASAILRGMVESGSFEKDELIGFEVNETRMAFAKEAFGIVPALSEADAAARSDVLLLAVKPQMLPDVLPRIAPALRPGTVVATIAAAKDLAFYAGFFPQGTPVVRLMPNINSKVKAATTAICPNEAVTPEQLEAVRAMFASVGSVIPLAEKDFTIFSAVAGSSVAFVYLYIAALMDSCTRAGLSEADARRIAADSVLGSAKLVLGCDEDPRDLSRQVCSPGGTTIEGIGVLRAHSFEDVITEAIDAVVRKDILLRQG